MIGHNHLVGPDEPHIGGGGLFARFRVSLTKTVITGNSPGQNIGR